MLLPSFQTYILPVMLSLYVIALLSDLFPASDRPGGPRKLETRGPRGECGDGGDEHKCGHRQTQIDGLTH